MIDVDISNHIQPCGLQQWEQSYTIVDLKRDMKNTKQFNCKNGRIYNTTIY